MSRPWFNQIILRFSPVENIFQTECRNVYLILDIPLFIKKKNLTNFLNKYRHGYFLLDIFNRKIQITNPELIITYYYYLLLIIDGYPNNFCKKKKYEKKIFLNKY